MNLPLNPKLRWPLDIRHEELDGNRLIVLSCPLGIIKEPLVLIAGVAPLLALFEGRLSITEIAERFTSSGVTPALVQELHRILDEHYLLEGPRFEAQRKKIVDEFRNTPVRAAALAGLSYPAEKEALTKLVHGYLKGNGIWGEAEKERGDLVMLMSPHIDYRRGGKCYGEGYRALESDSHSSYLLIGTAHQYAKGLFHISAKDFATPLGTLPCDREAVTTLATEYGIERSFSEELLHQREHSLELQTPFISATRTGTKIIPVLVGGFHQMIAEGKTPEHYEVYDAFLTALVALFKSAATPIGIIAGVDMAHIGRSFGDEFELTEDTMAEIRARDNRYLNALMTQDKQALFSHIAEDEDRRRICGFPTMYTMLDLLDRLGIRYRATLLGYHQAVDVPRGCAVTFASMGFYSLPSMQ